MMKKILFIGGGIIIVIVVLFILFKGSGKNNPGITLVKVEKGEIIDKAIAIGNILPKNEIAVKSKISGIVRKIFVEMGDKVKKGASLIDISPSPTPFEYAEAKRNVELTQVDFENATSEYNRAKELSQRNLISQQNFDAKSKRYKETKLRFELATEKLSLIEKGKTQIADKKIESVITSPIAGTVLQRRVEEGDPVVPLTSYQAGTELMTLAYMENLIFKGTVDEIDVGKLEEGMETMIKIGALPGEEIKGILDKISPKAKKEENATLFDVEIKITQAGEKMLRAGYSANAEIIINQKKDVLVIPERLIEFKGDSTFVEIKNSHGEITKREIKTGLSDGINIEVKEGLEEGNEVVERPPKEIT
jgi:HlyD family secretion protein